MAEVRKTLVDDPRAEQVLLDALRGRVRGRTELVRLTRADAVTLTGLPSAQAEPALKSLVKNYRSHLAVTEEGELVYEFDPSLERRDKVSLRERIEHAGALAWRGFKFLFKIWIVFTLVFYVLLFIAMMVSMMLVRSSSSQDRDDRRGGDFGIPWIWFWLMPDLAPARSDRWGRPVQRRSRGPRKRFYLSVFDYVFGQSTAPVDPREADKRLLAYLRDQRGRITTADLTALTGLSLDQAEEELTRLMATYDGDVEVAENGTLIYQFPDLLLSAEATGSHWSYVWDRPEVARPLTGNTGGTNAVITAFSGFNLLASLTIGPAFLERRPQFDSPEAQFFVTVFPLIFSLIFFSVPAGRALVERRRRRRRQQRALRSAVLREVWAKDGAPLDPVAVAKQVAQACAASETDAKAAIEAVLRDLDGDVDTSEQGEIRYLFPRIAEERRAVEKARAEAPAAEGQLGQVIFSSDE